MFLISWRLSSCQLSNSIKPHVLVTRSLLSSVKLAKVKPELELLYTQYNRVESTIDPVHLVRRYEDPVDREIAGFCTAALAFGRLASIITSIKALLKVMGSSPAVFVRRFDRTKHGNLIRPLSHRWTRGEDLIDLLCILRRMQETAGSIEKFFLRGYDDKAGDVGPALDSFCTRALDGVDQNKTPGVKYFFPKPAHGSACKRLNLYLRWMVRCDKIDFGIWKQVETAKLVIPLDIHVFRVGQCLRLTRYRSAGWAMVREITETLRKLDPDDPVKYDFSLCHLGMQKLCCFNQPQVKSLCPLQGLCQPGVRKIYRSR